MKIITIISIITIVNNLAQHLVSVLCAFDAQVPKNVVHKMQHLLVEKKKIREFLPIRVTGSTHLENIASRHAGHGQPLEWHYLHVDSCFQKFVHLCLIGGMPDWHSKD